MDVSTKLCINIDYLHENIKKILSFKSGDFMFVLKSNAYGFGYKEILNEIEQYDRVKYIGVALPNEAMFLRKYTKKEVVILGYTNDSMIGEVINLNIIPTIFEMRQANLFKKKQKVFINIDTGFNRLGVQEDLLKELVSQEYIDVQCVFTHLRLRDELSDNHQIDVFNETIHKYNIPYTSISDSIGYTRYNISENLYRIGASLFGYTSDKEKNKLKLQPIGQLVTSITRVKEIEEDTFAFYRSKLRKGQKIATIQIGYGDGLMRSMPKDSYVTINGAKCSYIEVGMDQSIIDVTNVEVSIYDLVIIFGEGGMSLQELAAACKTNKNNILTMIQHRVVREYIKDGNVLKKVGLWEENNECKND